MLKSYFTVAWRNLWKNNVFSLINILGLSIGIAFTLLIGAYVWGELQVNRNLKDADNQYIILSKWKDPNLGIEMCSIGQMPKALKDDYPQLVANGYHDDLVTTNVSKGDMHFRENLEIGDSTLLKMYGLKLLHGDANTALNDPFSVVIKQEMALKYFGRTDVVGETLNFESFSGAKHDFKITGVLQPLPLNSITHLNDVNSAFFFGQGAAKYFNRNIDGWNNIYIVDYVELQPGASPKAVEKAMRDLVVKNATPQIAQNLTPYLMPLKDYNLYANGGVIKKMTFTLSSIALFILLMAVINFVNICIGRSSGRMKEIGIRKVLGGLRKQLVLQFLAESILMVIISTLLALGFYLLTRPYFSDILGKEITGLFAFPWYFGVVLLLFALVVGLISGIYPALVLSAFKSIDSLKGKMNAVKESVLFRKSLVAFQFIIAAVVFIGAVIVSQQVGLFLGNNLGYNKDYVIYAQLPRDWSPKGVRKMEAIRSQLAQMPQVSSVALSYEIPNGNAGGSYAVYRQGANPAQAITSQNLVDDNQYADTYGIPMEAGTFFKPGAFMLADTTQAVINQTEAKALGWSNPASAINQKINFNGIPMTVCGVTADFHYGSMQDKIQPITFVNVNYANVYRYFSIKLKPGDIQESIAAIQQNWTRLMPDAPFEYHFMDDALKDLYASEIQLKKAAYLATGLAIIIVLLGVLGLTSLSIQKRTKEIGIRKVLGSSVTGITQLFLKDFLGVVAIAGVISCPLAWLIMHRWLDNYAYRIDISLLPFIISIGALTVVTALLIVVQTRKAAANKPVASLKSA